MSKDIETALRALNQELRVIKMSLDPLSQEFKRINSLEIELKRLKSNIIPKLKRLELSIHRVDSKTAPKDDRKLLIGYKRLEDQINKLKAEIILLRKKPKIDKQQDGVLKVLSENQSLIDRQLRKITKKFEEKYNLDFPLLTDIDHAVADAYGAWGEKSMYGKKYEGIIRSSILIDENGKVAETWYKVKPLETVPNAIEAV